MLKNKKIIFFSLFLIAFMLFLSTNVYATVDFEKDGVQYSYPDIPNQNGISLILNSGSNTYLLTSNYSLESILHALGHDTSDLSVYEVYFNVYYNQDFSIVIYRHVGDNYTLVFDGNNYDYSLKLSDSMRENLIACYALNGSSWTYDCAMASHRFTRSLSYIYSTCDVINTTNINDVFFQKTPPPVVPEPEIVEETILKPAIVETGMETTLNELISLLPLLIACLVGFLGLRKGLQMVLQLLANS